MPDRPRSATALATLVLVSALSVGATQTRVALSSAQNLWNGFPSGVSVSKDGVLKPGPAFIKSADLPGVPLCAVRSGAVWWVGTGPDGDLLKVEGGRVAVAHHFDAIGFWGPRVSRAIGGSCHPIPLVVGCLSLARGLHHGFRDIGPPYSSKAGLAP